MEGSAWNNGETSYRLNAILPSSCFHHSSFLLGLPEPCKAQCTAGARVWKPHFSLGQPTQYWPATALGGSKSSPKVPAALWPLHLEHPGARVQPIPAWEQNCPQQLQQCCREPIPQQGSPQMPGTASACSRGLYESNDGLCSGYSFCSLYTKLQVPFATPATEGRPARCQDQGDCCSVPGQGGARTTRSEAERHSQGCPGAEKGRQAPARGCMEQAGMRRPRPPLFTQDESSALPARPLHTQPDVVQQRMPPGVELQPSGAGKLQPPRMGREEVALPTTPWSLEGQRSQTQVWQGPGPPGLLTPAAHRLATASAPHLALTQPSSHMCFTKLV